MRRNRNETPEVPSAARQVPKAALSIDEAAWSLGVSIHTVERMLSDGELPYTRIRTKPVIDPDDLTTMVKAGKVRRNADPGFGRSGQSADGTPREPTKNALVKIRSKMPPMEGQWDPSTST